MKKYNNFTAVIPAGGKGSRFDKHINKLLFKVKNKTIFESNDSIRTEFVIYYGWFYSKVL